MRRLEEFLLLLLITIVVCSSTAADDCNDKCHVQENFTNFYKSYSRSCFCDRCSIYDDCCADADDYDEDDKEEEEEEEENRMRTRRNYECNLQLADSMRIYSISYCPPLPQNNKNYRILIDNCENADYDVENEDGHQSASKQDEMMIDMSELLKYLPVYSTLTNETYRNVYCAKCNQMNSFDVKKIKFYQIKSPNKNLNEMDQLQRNETAIVDLIREQQAKAGANIIEFDIPLIDDNQSVNVRKCLKLVDQCKEDYLELKEKCQSYTAARYVPKERIFYRNEHCAKCNGVNTSELVCMEPATFGRGYIQETYSHNLQILFDLSEIYGELKINLKIKMNDPASSSTYELIRNCSSGENETSSSNTFCKGSNNLEILTNVSINLISKRRRPSVPGAKSQCYDYRAKSELSIDDKLKRHLTTIGQSISIISLALLLVLYLAQKVLRNLPGKILISLSISLLFSQLVFILTPHLSPSTVLVEEIEKLSNQTAAEATTTMKSDRIDIQGECAFNYFFNMNDLVAQFKHGCFILGLLNHYFYLSFFCWTSVMAYDLYKMLRILSAKNQKASHRGGAGYDSEDSSETRVFINYSLYAWLSPLFIVLILLSSQLYFRHLAYGFNICYISSQLDQLMFFVAPVIAILLANAFFLVSSINAVRSIDRVSKRYLRRDNSEMKQQPLSKASSSSSTYDNHVDSKRKLKNLNNRANSSQKKRFILFTKVFIITGMTWILGIVSSFHKSSSAIWYFYIGLNSLQGLFIFLSFAFNPKTNRALRNSPRIQSALYYLTCCAVNKDDETLTTTTTATATITAAKNYKSSSKRNPSLTTV